MVIRKVFIRIKAGKKGFRTYIDRNNGMWISGDNIVTVKVHFSLKNTKISK